MVLWLSRLRGVRKTQTYRYVEEWRSGDPENWIYKIDRRPSMDTRADSFPRRELEGLVGVVDDELTTPQTS